MAFPVSPDVIVTENNITTIVPGSATAIGALAGVFRWGPVNKRVLVDSEKYLARRFGPPTNFNAETFFTGANFLAYSNAMETVRAANTTGTSPILSANIVSGNAAVAVGDTTDMTNGMILVATSNTSTIRIGATVTIANATHVTLSAASDALANGQSVNLQFVSAETAFNAIVNSAAVANLTAQIVTTEDAFETKFENSDFDTDVEFVAKWPGEIGNSLKISVCDSATAFSSNLDLTDDGEWVANAAFVVDSNTVVVTIGVDTDNDTIDVNTFNTFVSGITGDLTIGDGIVAGNTVVGTQLLNISSITTPAPITLEANSGATVNVSSGNATITTTSNDFEDVEAGDFIALFSNSSVYDVYKVDTVTNSNNIILSTEAAFTNTASTWTLLSGTSTSFNISTTDKYKRSQNTSTTSILRQWEYATTFDSAPGQSTTVLTTGNTAANDELHVVVVDENGKFSGVPGTVLEKFERLSRATDAKNDDGEGNYYMTVINRTSEYVWAVNDRTGAASANASNIASSTNDAPRTGSFDYGQDGSDESTVSIGVLSTAYDQFADKEKVDVSLIMQGKARGGVRGGQLANYINDNICEPRMDAVVFVSPDKGDVVNNLDREADDIVDFRNTLRSSSYMFLDSGYKYMFDRYNNVSRYIPLNGDMAGIAARSEQTNDAWWSPAGHNRGAVKNIIRLAYNPRKAERDLLYKNGVNNVVTFPGDGTILYGDKTLLAKPSAFDRINVRRLFIILEKSIARAAKYSLFEFNDAFTRAQFRNMVIPFLRDVQGRRGITEFMVVCDSTNNPPSVIDRNEFVGDIYIKPARSINFIQLNFHAVATGLAFTEIIHTS